MRKTYQKIIFDFDGTIVDSAIQKKNLFYHLDPVLSDRRSEINQILTALDGRPREEIFASFCTQFKVEYEVLEAKFEKAVEQIYKNARYEKGLECFSTVAIEPHMILTSTKEKDVAKFLQKSEYDSLFSTIIRPETSKYEYLERTHSSYPPSSILFFGDGPQDYACSVLTQIDYVHVSQWSDYTPPPFTKRSESPIKYFKEFLHE